MKYVFCVEDDPVPKLRRHKVISHIGKILVERPPLLVGMANDARDHSKRLLPGRPRFI
jgi:hypothetical protein